MRTVHLCHQNDSPLMILDREGSTRLTHIAVSDVPDEVSSAAVVLKVSYLTFIPWPKNPVPWPEIADLTQGAIIRGRS